MQRRAFLSSLLKGAVGLTAAAALPVFDPEYALWVPSARSFFDLGATRPDRDWFDEWCDDELTQPIDATALCARNNLLTTDIITREALAVLAKQLTFANTINREYDPGFAETVLSDRATGLTLRIPDRFRHADTDVFKARIEYEVRDLVFINPRRVCRIDGVTG